MKQLLKIVLILLYSPPSQCTDVKSCFLVLWFNCEFRIETGNEKCKNKMPCQFTIFGLTISKQNAVYVLFSKKKKWGKENTRGVPCKTLEVYNVKILEVYHVKHWRCIT